MQLTQYEKSQISEIKKWKEEEPTVVSQAFGIIMSPATWLINKIIPDAAIRGALDFSSSAAEWLTDTKDVLRDANVSRVSDLRKHDLETSDKLANGIHNWAIGLASVEGGATGAAGVIGIAADIPSIIVLALRTIHKIGICYGFEVRTKRDKELVLAILSASGANDMTQKVAALGTIRQLEIAIATQTWKQIAKNAATNNVGKDAAIIGIKNLSKQLGINLTKRKALQAIPVIGAAVGATVNGWYIKEVGWAARRAFQEQWLIGNNKIDL